MEAEALIPIIIGLIVLIVFFVLAARVGSIKEILEHRASTPVTQTSYAQFYEQGELNEYLGKKLEAIEAYKTAWFYVEKIKTPSNSDSRNKEQIKKKLSELN